jgi:hypothetical protein
VADHEEDEGGVFSGASEAVSAEKLKYVPLPSAETCPMAMFMDFRAAG